jgi:tRNA (guanine37-N1)-methyltransferase
MRIHIITAFPGMFDGFMRESMLARALTQGILSIVIHDLRDFADDPHRTIDDTPFGGGGGMILKPEPVGRAIESICPVRNGTSGMPLIIPTPRGELFNQSVAGELARQTHLVFVCGHYTGIDERIYDYFQPRRLCVGDYVLSGGELPAMAIIDATSRLLPGFLGNEDSGKGDSFVRSGLGAPQYTRPQNWRGLEVPDVLVSGHHANVAEWRERSARETTQRFRPDLIGSPITLSQDRSAGRGLDGVSSEGVLKKPRPAEQRQGDDEIASSLVPRRGGELSPRNNCKDN